MHVLLGTHFDIIQNYKGSIVCITEELMRFFRFLDKNIFSLKLGANKLLLSVKFRKFLYDSKSFLKGLF